MLSRCSYGWSTTQSYMENMVSEEALDAFVFLPVLDELDREPTLEELNAALDGLAPGKAPGKKGIPAKVL